MRSKAKLVSSIVFGALYAALFAYMISQSATTAGASEQSSDEVVGFLLKFRIFAELDKAHGLSDLTRKLFGHFGEYGLLGIFGFFFWLNFDHPLRRVADLSIGLISSVATEIVQLFANERGPSVFDILLNFQGYLTAVLLLTLIFAVIKTVRSEIIKREYKDHLLTLPFCLIAIMPFAFYGKIFFGAKCAYYIFCTSLIITSLYIVIVNFVRSHKKTAD